MQVHFASIPGSRQGRPNEDWVAASTTTAVVLDGVTSPAELGSGCIHSVPWYVRNLGSRLLSEATTDQDAPLAECLRRCISAVAELHAGTCDLQHEGTPSATVAMLRETPGAWDYLVLSDAVLALRNGDEVEAVSDSRVSAVVADEVAAVHAEVPGTEEHHKKLLTLVEAQRRFRNVPGGYWLAGSRPEAAAEAISGSRGANQLQQAALMTDGASCLVDVYGQWTWLQLMDALANRGPSAVMKEVRRVEATDPNGRRWPRYKSSDDSTVAFAVNNQRATPRC